MSYQQIPLDNNKLLWSLVFPSSASGVGRSGPTFHTIYQSNLTAFLVRRATSYNSQLKDLLASAHSEKACEP